MNLITDLINAYVNLAEEIFRDVGKSFRDLCAAMSRRKSEGSAVEITEHTGVEL